MPKFIVKDAVVSINNVTLSNRVAQVAVEMNADDVDVSTMGTGVHQHLAGLRNDQFTMTFLSDFDAAQVDATLFPLLATATTQTEFTVSVTPNSLAVSSTNPKYVSDNCILLTYQPISGAVGARSETAVTFPSNAAIRRQTT
jgi:hypothetical protein